MRFSLQDVLWLITLASVAIYNVIVVRGVGWLGPHEDVFGDRYVPVILSPGLLLGAGIGNLFQRPKTGAAMGVLLNLLLCWVLFSTTTGRD